MEVEIEEEPRQTAAAEEDDEAGLVQTFKRGQADRGKETDDDRAGPEPDPPSSRLENSPAGTTDDPARDLHRLRDELEKRWVEGEAVHHVVRAAADAIRRGPRAQEGLDILDDVAVVIPQADVTTTCDASTSLPLSPAQNKWISEVVEAIHKAMAEAWDRREEEVTLMQRTMTGLAASGKAKRDLVQQLNEELTQQDDEEATTLSMKLMRAIQSRASQIRDWDRVQAVLVGHTGKKGKIWCGDRLSVVHTYRRAEETASSSSDQPTLILPGAGEDPAAQRARLKEVQNQHDSDLYEWHRARLQADAQAEAAEAKRQEDNTWSSGPPTKRLRVAIDVRGAASSRYSEIEVRPGETVSLNIQASIADHGMEMYKAGRSVNPRDGLKALREEEERLNRGDPGERRSAAEDQRAGWSTNSPDIRPHYEAWRNGQLDFRRLQDLVGPDRAMFIVEAAEIAGLQLDTLPDMDVSIREAWQAGQPVESLLRKPECTSDYKRWSTGDLTQWDVIDKWGGDVYRVFQAWYMEGHQPDGGPVLPGHEDVAGEAKPRETGQDNVRLTRQMPVTSEVTHTATAPDEMETEPYDTEEAGESELSVRRRRTHEAMLRRRVLYTRADRRRALSKHESPGTDDAD